MSYVTHILLGSCITWILMLAIVPIAQRLADSSMPPWKEMLWKLAVVAVAVNAVSAVFDPVIGVFANGPVASPVSGSTPYVQPFPPAARSTRSTTIGGVPIRRRTLFGLAFIASSAVAFVLFKRWFDMDLFGAMIVSVATSTIQLLLVFALSLWRLR